ncbi:nucleotidyltransferase family protein [bacterium]|nr:nucleotidyltransferase family protein [bacterium]
MKINDETFDKIKELGSIYGITSIQIFGSYANGTQEPGSDLDLLVTIEEGRDLLDIIGFKLDVEELLGIDVDVVTENALSPYFREEVLKEAVAI